MGASDGSIARALVKTEDVAEMYRLLELIDDKFKTDPMSVQCFDLQIVKRVNEVLEKTRRQGHDNLIKREFFEVPTS
jgi:hypothetical protein